MGYEESEGCKGRTKRTTGQNTYLNAATFPAQCCCVQETVLYFDVDSSRRLPEGRVTCRGMKMHMRRLKVEIPYEKRRTNLE
ncbi:hypothetical protein EVAR_94700_1 [Eumeta japonica]|uniref:Uncharacterized protein n=1 Tax=Eumeta variegata TaxID=151549 RepID=A0A4C1UWB1_EUMVA|nr:hypothetical protein EVAR_94700_1 [Eumeta japonica]